MPSPAPIRIGLISDTHGLLRPEAMAALQGCDHIIHSGDIGHRGILEELARLAPLAVVRGNNDREDWAMDIPESATLKIGGLSIHVLHNIAELDMDPHAAGFHAVVSGHSHRPGAKSLNGVLYVNPGSAGPRRFSLPISLGYLFVSDGVLNYKLEELHPPAAASPRSRRKSR